MARTNFPKTTGNAKYKSVEHRRLRARYADAIRAGHALDCTATICVFDRAPITNPNGRDRDGLHLGHNDDGVTYAGPQHNACNVKDGARRGNARQRGVEPEPHGWIL